MGDTFGQPVWMPWKVSSPVSERVMFVTRLRSGERMTDLCSEFGISRKTGYKLLERFERLGPSGLFDVSRRPHRLAREKPGPRVPTARTAQATCTPSCG